MPRSAIRPVPRALLLLATLVVLTAGAARAQSYPTTSLALDGKLHISLVEAIRIRKLLGQLLMVNVDGFGISGPLAVAPGFLDLVEELQIGAVIPHYGRQDPSVIRATNTALRECTEEPLLIASDIVTLRASDGSTASFGDGYVGGFIGKHRELDDVTFERLAFLNAFVCRALGMSCTLWPTIDASTKDDRAVARAAVVLDQLEKLGFVTTLKHWPFVPQGVDLHRESVDSAFTLAEVRGKTAPFRELASRGGLLMTTHVYDSLVDPGVVTLSSDWMQILRQDVGFSGPLVTDGLFMLRYHRARAAVGQAMPGLGSSGDDEIAGWAARAILAGHDVVIAEGGAATSRHVLVRLLELACRDDELGRRMRERIDSAHAKVAELKERRRGDLEAVIDAPPALIDRVISLVSRGEAGLRDDTAYAALSAETASVCEALPSWKGR